METSKENPFTKPLSKVQLDNVLVNRIHFFKPIGADKVATARQNGKIGIGKVDGDSVFIEKKNFEADLDTWGEVLAGLVSNEDAIRACLPFRHLVKKFEFSDPKDNLDQKGYYLTGVWYDRVYRIDIRFMMMTGEDWQACRGVSLKIDDVKSLLANLPELILNSSFKSDQATKRNLQVLGEALYDRFKHDKHVALDTTLRKVRQEGESLMRFSTFYNNLHERGIMCSMSDAEAPYYKPAVILLARAKVMRQLFVSRILESAANHYLDLVDRNANCQEGAENSATKARFFRHQGNPSLRSYEEPPPPPPGVDDFKPDEQPSQAMEFEPDEGAATMKGQRKEPALPPPTPTTDPRARDPRVKASPVDAKKKRTTATADNAGTTNNQ
jgi:hypothetical protein